MDLLVLALTSTTPLTDLIINSGKISDESSLDQSEEENDSKDDDDDAMILKVTLRKSNKEFLFAQAKAGFVDFLLSFFTIPLGAAVGSNLGGKTCLIDNLYTSLTNGVGKEYFKDVDVITRPRLAFGYISRNAFLPFLTRENNPKLYFLEDSGMFSLEDDGSLVKSFRSSVSLHEGYYVCKRLTEYIVRDDLTVTAYSLASSISILDGFEVSFSDVEEREVRVGADEALGILKVSLTSTKVLSNALRRRLPGE